MPRNCSGTLEQRREALTKHYYEEECGIDLKDVTLHSFEEMSAETLAAAEEDELVEKWFGPLLNTHTLAFVRLERSQAASVCSPAAPAATLAAAGPFVQVLLKADGEAVDAGNALHLLNAGFVVNPKDFGLKKGHARRAEAAQRQADSQVAQARTKLAEPLSRYVRAVRRRRSRCTGERHYRARTIESSRGFDFAFP